MRNVFWGEGVSYNSKKENTNNFNFIQQKEFNREIRYWGMVNLESVELATAAPSRPVVGETYKRG